MLLHPEPRSLSLTFIVFLWFTNCVFSQSGISGQVVDSFSGEPLAFANIVFDEEQKLGVTADLHGYFSIPSKAGISRIRISYIGYRTRWIDVSTQSGNLVVQMSPSGVQLDEILILGDRNPTESLMRKVIANRKKNDPERSRSFTYKSYNKINFELIPSGGPKNPRDSSYIRLLENARKTGLLIMESVSERKFIYPDRDEETILATKVSGLKNPLFAALATDFQPFSFYREIISILDMNYINPIADGSLNRYEYVVQDTLYQGFDTVYTVVFRPQKGKNFDALKGILYINTEHYAIQNVIARPADPGLMDIEIEQKYVYADREQWFPSELNFELILENYPQKGVGLRAKGESYLREVNLNPEISAGDFSIENVRMADSAGMKETGYWEEVRQDSLSLKEENTYQLIDSLGEKFKFDQLMKQAEKLTDSRLGLKQFDLMLDKLYVFNEYEGHRPGLGLRTNETLSKRFSVGGYGGYGFRDQTWKYGADLTVKLYRPRDVELSLTYVNDVSEPGQSVFEGARGFTNVRSYLTSRMDKAEIRQATLKFRGFRYSQFQITGQNNMLDPRYDYRFLTGNGEFLEGPFITSELTLSMRYAFRERIVESFGKRIPVESKFPVIELSYTEGIPNILGAELAYRKVEGQVSDEFVTKRFGTTRFLIRGGIAEGNLPATLLYHGSGGLNGDVFLYVENYFQTMNPYEFLSDRYAQVFIYQDFGSLLFKAPKFKPQISLAHAMGIGLLAQPAVHGGIEFRTMEKGFFESGLIVRQILRFNYLNIAYLGLGGGIFYRYGAYQHEDLKQNLAAKIVLSFSTN